MTKLEIQAIQQLPEDFIRDGTAVCLVTNNTLQRCVVAVNPEMLAICFWECRNKWEPMPYKLEDSATLVDPTWPKTTAEEAFWAKHDI